MDSQGTSKQQDNNSAAGTVWFDESRLGPKDNDIPITKDEILNWIGKIVDKEIFEIRNLNSRRTEDEAQRLRQYQEYLRNNLK